jgi:hypothetical protein
MICTIVDRLAAGNYKFPRIFFLPRFGTMLLTPAQQMDPCQRRNSLRPAGNRLRRWLISRAEVNSM